MINKRLFYKIPKTNHLNNVYTQTCKFTRGKNVLIIFVLSIIPSVFFLCVCICLLFIYNNLVWNWKQKSTFILHACTKHLISQQNKFVNLLNNYCFTKLLCVKIFIGSQKQTKNKLVILMIWHLYKLFIYLILNNFI